MSEKEYVLTFCTHKKADSVEDARAEGRTIEQRFSYMYFLEAKLNPEQ